MDYCTKLGLKFLLFTYFLTTINGQDACVKTGPCRCEFANGTGIDLTPESKSTFFTSEIYKMNIVTKQLELSKYYYHPCYDAVPPINPWGVNDTCNKNLSICRQVYTLDFNSTGSTYKMDGGVAEYIGNTNDSVFSVPGDAIIYKNGPSNTKVLLVCAQTDDQFHIMSLDEPNAIVLSFYSRAACLKTLKLPDEGRSLGSTLLIIFFSVSIFYLVLGICTKKFLMGATGIEIIPNLAFWTDLPNLVKDGWAFAIAGFKLPVRGSGPALSPDPNSYDSI